MQIMLKAEDLNSLTPQGLMAAMILEKRDRSNPINAGMAELFSEQARSEKIDNDRKADLVSTAEAFGKAIDRLSTTIYKSGYDDLDDDAKKRVNELASKLI